MSNFLLYACFPRWIVAEPFEDAINKWESINIHRKCPAIGSVDAHRKKFIPLFFSKIFNYNYLFKTIRTNIFTDDELTGDIEGNKKIILKALAEGSSYIVNYEISNPSGFKFIAKYNKIAYKPGDSVYLENGGKIIFSVISPESAEIILLCNNQAVANIIDTELDYISGNAGNYRVEVIFSNRKWILSNFIYVFLKNLKI